MKTIKIIDLFNKIANGEDVPRKIKFHNKVFIYDKEEELYRNEEISSNTLKHMFYLYHLEKILNDEVEIIEEDKKIEKLNSELLQNEHFEHKYNEYDLIDIFCYKLNEVIDAVNKLNKK